MSKLYHLKISFNFNLYKAIVNYFFTNQNVKKEIWIDKSLIDYNSIPHACKYAKCFFLQQQNVKDTKVIDREQNVQHKKRTENGAILYSRIITVTLHVTLMYLINYVDKVGFASQG